MLPIFTGITCAAQYHKWGNKMPTIHANVIVDTIKFDFGLCEFGRVFAVVAGRCGKSFTVMLRDDGTYGLWWNNNPKGYSFGDRHLFVVAYLTADECYTAASAMVGGRDIVL